MITMFLQKFKKKTLKCTVPHYYNRFSKHFIGCKELNRSFVEFAAVGHIYCNQKLFQLKMNEHKR